MKRRYFVTRRVLLVFRVVFLAGGRGITSLEVLERLRDRGERVGLRTIQRDLRALATELELCCERALDGDTGNNQSFIYFVDRTLPRDVLVPIEHLAERVAA
jgi:hypothetical protein